MSFFSKKIQLPRTVDGFNALVDVVVKKYSLPSKDHASVVIANAIRHLPNDQATTTISYLGSSVIKNIANQTAAHIADTIKHESQVQYLADLLRTDPNNNQARDELERAANDGSLSAKKALEEFNQKGAESATQVMDSNVTPIKGA